MKKQCKQCEEDAVDGKSFCSSVCRNNFVSSFMLKKSKRDKKEFGNAYYLKKQNGTT